MSNHAEEIKQVIAEMREEAFEREQQDWSAGVIADNETAEQLREWADRLEKATLSAQTLPEANKFPRYFIGVQYGDDGVPELHETETLNGPWVKFTDLITAPSPSKEAVQPSEKDERKPEFNSLGIAKHWSVTVEVGGERVLCISDQHYAGLDVEPYKETIQNCAEHLLSFIGARRTVGEDGRDIQLVEAALKAAAEKVPGGSICDPQQLADAIRYLDRAAIVASVPVEQQSSSMSDEAILKMAEEKGVLCLTNERCKRIVVFARALLSQAPQAAKEDFHIGVSVEPDGTHVQVWDGETKLHEQFYEMPQAAQDKD